MNRYIYDDQLALIGEPPVIGFGSDAFCVSEIMRDVANDLIKRHHYSKRIVSNSKHHLGVFQDGRLLGVLQYGYAMNPASADSVVKGTATDEYLELNRMWLSDVLPRNSESRALSLSIKFLRKRAPKVKWIQSFADERCGALGVVYQAANFLFVGSHIAEFVCLDGEFYHNSILTNSKTAHTPRGRRLRENLDRIEIVRLRQYRYIYFMQRRFMKGLRHKVRPYPKRD